VWNGRTLLSFFFHFVKILKKNCLDNIFLKSWSLLPRFLFLKGLVQICCRRTKLRPFPFPTDQSSQFLDKGQREMLFIHCLGFPKFRENTHHIHLQVTLTSKSAPEKQHRFQTPSRLYFFKSSKSQKASSGFDAIRRQSPYLFYPPLFYFIYYPTDRLIFTKSGSEICYKIGIIHKLL